MSQHVDGATLGDLALQAGEELAACRAVHLQRQRLRRLRLGGTQEGCELDQIDAVLSVVVVWVPTAPAAATVALGRLAHGAFLRRVAGVSSQGGADQPF